MAEWGRWVIGLVLGLLGMLGGAIVTLILYIWKNHVDANNEVEKRVEDLENLSTEIQLHQRQFDTILEEVQKKISAEGVKVK